ncbi:helix-turn-helix domain-containing protein [Streptomyces sp. JJ38]|uniref:helix-turn-helix domain-containing protein n=1 Tax=Streptomyces sp. JJ38 TaxID=2738128 RepID=UPI001C59B92F|nr:helix-turn-helix transcriptional regulator [Streptomyces sp. JJ38]MBW1597507.1 helix-turn-helix transcriptional regulator [Streptomyces sp. JJ38]
METAELPGVGTLLREWRQHRRLSQLQLALDADSSARHVSYVETGRARPSREMVLRLAETLDVPLRERNTLLLAAGYAPAFRESAMDAAEMAAVRSALDVMLTAHEPYPAVVVDRVWNVVSANEAMGALLDGLPAGLAEPPANVYRMVLHPEGLLTRVVNADEVRHHLLDRLRRQARASGDAELRALHEEVAAYGPWVEEPEGHGAGGQAAGPVALPVRLRGPHGELSMFSTIATFGAPADVTLSELAIESFFPSDEATARAFRALAEERAR